MNQRRSFSNSRVFSSTTKSSNSQFLTSFSSFISRLLPLGGRGAATRQGQHNSNSSSQQGHRKVVLDERLYDKERVRYTGSIFGLNADTFVRYLKINGGVFVILLGLVFIFKGYLWLSEFSMAAVARMGFLSGLATGVVLISLVTLLKRHCQISPNAVYNQSIALVMRHPTCGKLLGTHPRTGEFKAYCATGGFKLPLLRRIRSGSYELSDLLGTKPRRLQMMFILKNPSNMKEGLVSVDVWKERTGTFTYVNHFKSLAVCITDSKPSTSSSTALKGSVSAGLSSVANKMSSTIKGGFTDPVENSTTVIIIGNEADMIMRNFTKR